jgi:hypothetical protein
VPVPVVVDHVVVECGAVAVEAKAVKLYSVRTPTRTRSM